LAPRGPRRCRENARAWAPRAALRRRARTRACRPFRRFARGSPLPRSARRDAPAPDKGALAARERPRREATRRRTPPDAAPKERTQSHPIDRTSRRLNAAPPRAIPLGRTLARRNEPVPFPPALRKPFVRRAYGRLILVGPPWRPRRRRPRPPVEPPGRR